MANVVDPIVCIGVAFIPLIWTMSTLFRNVSCGIRAVCFMSEHEAPVSKRNLICFEDALDTLNFKTVVRSDFAVLELYITAGEI